MFLNLRDSLHLLFSQSRGHLGFASRPSSPEIYLLHGLRSRRVPPDLASTLWWWRHVVPTFARLFRLASTAPELRRRYLQFIVDELIPHFGPSPPDFWKIPKDHIDYRPTVHTPIEVIWVLGDEIKPMSVRFVMDVLDAVMGVPRNPEEMRAVSSQLFQSSVMTKFDSTWLDVCYDSLVYHDWRNVKSGHHTVQFFPGGEFGPEGLIAKQYYYPTMRANETGTPAFEVVSHCMARLGLSEQFLCVVEFFQNNGHYGAVPEFVGVEGVLPEENRIKCYVRILFFLGPRDPAIQLTISAFSKLWKLLYPSHNDDENVESIRPGAKGMLIYFEMSLSRRQPIPKIYIPLYRFAGNDKHVAQAIQQYYRETNQGGKIERDYIKNFNILFPHIDSTSTQCPWAHCYLGIATKKGVTQMTVYYSLDSYGVAH
ncbi:tryptophan dimethylallyltransferase-domain-containing protein [Flagelloscypha sp. PMI_526]|nr:tryptophan dimethylallyltransferase-domain-containing protein [Flagelloscypha sp. PMI_526]